MKKKQTKDFLRAFGKHLAVKRKEKGFSQEALSFEVGLDVMTISRIERGILNISIDNTYQIAKALGMPYRDLHDFEV